MDRNPCSISPSRGKTYGRFGQLGSMPRSACQLPPRFPAAQQTRAPVECSDAFQKGVEDITERMKRLTIEQPPTSEEIKLRRKTYMFKSTKQINNFENGIVNLIQRWKKMSNPQLLQNCKTYVFIQNAVSESASFILDFNWENINIQIKTDFSLVLEQMLNNLIILKCHPELIESCRFLLCIIKHPRDHNLLSKLFLKPSQKEVSDFFQFEKIDIFLVRLKLLFEETAIKSAVKLSSLAIRFESNYNNDLKNYEIIRDIFFACLLEIDKREEFIDHLKQYSYEEGQDLLDTYLSDISLISSLKKEDRSRLCDTMLDVYDIAAFILISKSLSDPNYTNNFIKLFKVWIKIMFTLIDSDLERDRKYLRVQSMIHKFIERAPTSNHIFGMCDMLLSEVGQKLPRSFYRELYIKALAFIINEKEKCKLSGDKNKEYNLMILLVQGYLKMANLLDDVFKVSRECILSAFCLMPSVDLMNKLEEMAMLSDKIHDVNRYTSSDRSVEFDEKYINYHTYSIFCFDLADTSDPLSKCMINQLLSILRYPRFGYFNWIQDWSSLKSLCERYLTFSDTIMNRTRFKTSDLKCINSHIDAYNFMKTRFLTEQYSSSDSDLNTDHSDTKIINSISEYLSCNSVSDHSDTKIINSNSESLSCNSVSDHSDTKIINSNSESLNYNSVSDHSDTKIINSNSESLSCNSVSRSKEKKRSFDQNEDCSEKKRVRQNNSYSSTDPVLRSSRSIDEKRDYCDKKKIESNSKSLSSDSDLNTDHSDTKIINSNSESLSCNSVSDHSDTKIINSNSESLSCNSVSRSKEKKRSFDQNEDCSEKKRVRQNNSYSSTDPVLRSSRSIDEKRDYCDKKKIESNSKSLSSDSDLNTDHSDTKIINSNSESLSCNSVSDHSDTKIINSNSESLSCNSVSRSKEKKRSFDQNKDCSEKKRVWQNNSYPSIDRVLRSSRSINEKRDYCDKKKIESNSESLSSDSDLNTDHSDTKIINSNSESLSCNSVSDHSDTKIINSNSESFSCNSVSRSKEKKRSFDQNKDCSEKKRVGQNNSYPSIDRVLRSSRSINDKRDYCDKKKIESNSESLSSNSISRSKEKKRSFDQNEDCFEKKRVRQNNSYLCTDRVLRSSRCINEKRDNCDKNKIEPNSLKLSYDRVLRPRKKFDQNRDFDKKIVEPKSLLVNEQKSISRSQTKCQGNVKKGVKTNKVMTKKIKIQVTEKSKKRGKKDEDEEWKPTSYYRHKLISLEVSSRVLRSYSRRA